MDNGKKGQLKRFTRFKHLPAELRVKIWGMSVDQRVIRCRWELETRKFRRPDGLPASCYRIAAGFVPGILQANRESRYEALKRYTLTQVRIVDGKPMKTQLVRNRKVYVNFDLDIFYMLGVGSSISFFRWLDYLQKTPDARGKLCRALHFAFPERMVWQFRYASLSLKKLIHGLCSRSPEMLSIAVVRDNNSNFKTTNKPQNYTLKPIELHCVRPSPHTIACRGKSNINERTANATRELFRDSPEYSYSNIKKEHPQWKRPMLDLRSISSRRVLKIGESTPDSKCGHVKKVKVKALPTAPEESESMSLSKTPTPASTPPRRLAQSGKSSPVSTPTSHISGSARGSAKTPSPTLGKTKVVKTTKNPSTPRVKRA